MGGREEGNQRVLSVLRETMERRRVRGKRKEAQVTWLVDAVPPPSAQVLPQPLFLAAGIDYPV